MVDYAVHPITGVKINAMPIERISLNRKDAVTAFIMRMQGEKYANIAHKLGTNTFRLGPIFREEEHIGAKQEAERLLAGSPH